MYAPILITVYDRLDRLKKCVESLKENPESSMSMLYIASDCFFCNEEEDSINKVREYCSGISGFKDVIVLEREVNIGSYENLHDAVSYVLELHGNIIFIEDDNIVSSGFLKYMNKGLSKYKESERIFFICSYLFPKCRPRVKGDVFLWKGFSPWGFATWKKKWDQLEFSRSTLYKRITLKQLFNLWLVDPQSLGVALEDITGLVNATDVRICTNLVRLGGYSMFPVMPVSVNRGHDGGGEHGSNSVLFMNQPLGDKELDIPTNELNVNSSASYMFFHRFKLSSIYSLLRLLRLYFLKVNL